MGAVAFGKTALDDYAKITSGMAMATRTLAGGLTGGTSDLGIQHYLMGKEVTWQSAARTFGTYLAGAGLSEMVSEMLNVKDPIHVARGAFLQRDTDMALPDVREPILWERDYDSSRPDPGIFGKGWRTPWEGRLWREESGRLFAETFTGALAFFEKKDGGYEETGRIRGRYGLLCDEEGQCWRMTDFHTHRVYRYDREGRLERVTDRNGLETVAGYKDGRLESLTTPLGHRLSFRFEGGRLTEASDETGRTVRYRYEKGLLAEVRSMAGGSIRYRYGENGLIEAISDAEGTTWCFLSSTFP